jgi:hypothetical protein
MRHRPVRTESGEHPAVRAWALQQATAPAGPMAVQILQKRRKAVVYRLVGAGADGSDVVAKRSSSERIGRESFVYEHVLPALPVPVPPYYGTLTEAGTDAAWLFVAHAGQVEYRPDLAPHRTLAARWLAALHTAGATAARAAGLPERGPDHFRRELEAAREEILRHLDNPALRPRDVEVLHTLVDRCEAAAARWAEVESICRLTPPTVVHGDFAPKNLRLDAAGPGATLRPFDWAGAGWGTPAPDLPQPDAAPSTYWAGPDLDAYRERVARSWPDLAREDLDRLALAGKLFRTLVCLRLEATGLAGDWPQAAMKDMRLYRADLDDVLAAAGWKR